MNKVKISYKDKWIEYDKSLFEENKERVIRNALDNLKPAFPVNYKSYNEYNDLIKGYWDKKNPRPEEFKSEVNASNITIEYE
ncbi:MAG: hypothetical protein EOM67_10435 [Spirochaetia bacterium]|nr:hypothetical protein [Spirochaetia bacterium]